MRYWYNRQNVKYPHVDIVSFSIQLSHYYSHAGNILFNFLVQECKYGDLEVVSVLHFA